MREKLASAGAMIGAVLASACCWLPLLLIAVGAGGAVGIAGTFAAYRIPLAILALAALGSAWFFTYRKPASRKAEADPCTRAPQAGESCCPPSKVRRLNKVLLWILTPLVLTFTLFPHQVFSLFRLPSAQQDSPIVITESEEQIVLRVEGMT